MVERAITDFISYLELQKRSSKLTVEGYKNDLDQFLSFLHDEMPRVDVSAITYQHIRGFIAHLMEKQLAARSVNRKLSSLKSFFKYLVKTQVIQQNPAQKIQGPKAPKKLPVFVDQSQTEKMFSQLEQVNDFEGHRNRLLIDILYQTGIRRAELMGLKETDVDLFNLQLKVLGKRNKERIIPFNLELKRNLQAYLAVKKEQNFSNPFLLVSTKDRQMSSSQISKIVKDILATVSTGKKKSPHVLRHTFATHMLNNGADINAVKELLGHASLAATQIYTHNTIDQRKKTYQQAHPRSGQ